MKQVLAALATTAIMLMAVLVPTTSAHVPSVALTCADGAQVHLTNYNTEGEGTNSVVVTLDGNEVANNDDFGSTFDYAKDGLSKYVGHTLHVVVKAWDDESGDKGFSIDVTKEIDACSHKVFVCKYVGTPNVDERLQTGQNPIDVDEHSIPDFNGSNLADLVGKFFADAQGRSFVLAIDVGQDEPDISACPPPDEPPPPPVPPTFRLTCENVTVAGITEGWQFIVEPGDRLLENGRNALPPGDYTYELRFEGKDIKGGEFKVELCGEVNVTAAPCPAVVSAVQGATTPSKLRFVGLLALFTVKVDGQVVVPDAQGEVEVTPGLRHVTVLAADGETVLFDGDVECPVCRDTFEGTPVPSIKTAPPTDTEQSSGTSGPSGSLPLVLIVLTAVGGAMLFTTRKRAS